ncbi:hypothetical protein ES708_23698 [subsurface metagenome]
MFKDIVRDAIEAFYPSKEEQLIKELKELTEDGFEELRGILELDDIEFKNLLSLLDSSIVILREDHQRIMKGIEEILERLKIGNEMSFKRERELPFEVCNQLYNLIMEGEYTTSDKMYVAISKTFNNCFNFFAERRYYLKDIYGKTHFIEIEKFYNELFKLEKIRNRIFYPETLWDQKETIWKTEELSYIIRGQIEVRERVKKLINLAEELHRKLCIKE